MGLFFVTFSILLYFSNATPIESDNKTFSTDDIEIIESYCKLRIHILKGIYPKLDSLNKVCFQSCLGCFNFITRRPNMINFPKDHTFLIKILAREFNLI